MSVKRKCEISILGETHIGKWLGLRRCRESEGKAKIEGYMSVSDEEAHHPLSTEIVTVLSHIAIGEC